MGNVEHVNFHSNDDLDAFLAKENRLFGAKINLGHKRLNMKAFLANYVPYKRQQIKLLKQIRAPKNVIRAAQHVVKVYSRKYKRLLAWSCNHRPIVTAGDFFKMILPEQLHRH